MCAKATRDHLHIPVIGKYFLIVSSRLSFVPDLDTHAIKRKKKMQMNEIDEVTKEATGDAARKATE